MNLNPVTKKNNFIVTDAKYLTSNRTMAIKKDSYYIDRILEGYTSDYSILIDKYKDMVFTISLRITGNREDSEEVAQDVFLKAYNGLAEFRGTSKFSTWLYKITYNQSISKIRKKQLNVQSYDAMEVNITELHGEPDKEHLQFESIPVEYLKMAFNKLEETDRIILTLFYQDDRNIKDISEITGLSSSNVKIKLFRSRKKLVELLEKLLQTELIDLI